MTVVGMMVYYLEVSAWYCFKEPHMNPFVLQNKETENTAWAQQWRRYTAEEPFRLLQWAHEIVIRGDTRLSDACLSHICVFVCTLVFSPTLHPLCATFKTLMSSAEMKRGGGVLNCHDEHGWFVIIHVDIFNLMWLRNREAVIHRWKLLWSTRAVLSCLSFQFPLKCRDKRSTKGWNIPFFQPLWQTN